MTRPGRYLSGAAFLLALAAACSSSSSKSSPPPAGPLLHVASPAWQDQVIYMVMTDRFANGDTSNDNLGGGEYDPVNKEKYSGGDLKGLIDKLDYIQGLGATAVWITPPVANMWWDPLVQAAGYHGYWARHLKQVDEHLGTLDTYKALSSALHGRGMYLVQDVVPNHMGNYFTWSPSYPLACGPTTTVASCATGPAISGCDVTAGFVKNTGATPSTKPTQAPFDQNDPTDPAQRTAAIYHWTPAVADYGNDCQVVNYAISDLDDLNSDNPVVRSALRDSYGYWVKEVGVDAFRVDTAKFVPHAFWNDFFHSTDPTSPGISVVAKATGRNDFLAFGEVADWSGPMDSTADTKVASYLGTSGTPELPSVLQFPLYGEIGRVFAAGQPTAYMSYRLGRMMDPALFPNPYVLPTFIDNHDNSRFLYTSSPTGLDLLQALSFLFTVPGIPVVYYGTEQGFTVTRAAMFKGGYGSNNADHYDTSNALYQRVKKLATLRRSLPVLTRGGLDVRYDAVAGPGPLVYRRTLAGETVLVVLNTAKHKSLLGALDTGLAGGTAFDVLHDESYVSTPAVAVGAGGLLTMELPAKAVLVLRAAASGTPPAPGAVITVSTPSAGQTFTQDVTFRGTVSPAGTRLQLVLDDNLENAQSVTVAGDGSWSVVLPVSQFATGTFQHDLAFYAPDAKVATPKSRFTTEVAFAGLTYNFPDPAGDDTGPAGSSYTYPGDPSFGHQMDITNVKVEVGTTTMRLNFAMADFSSVWGGPNGFDHVALSIYFQLPGQTPTATVMPLLNASVPSGFAWNLNQFSDGWHVNLYTAAGATATSYGDTAISPTVKVDAGARTITFTYDRSQYPGLTSWSGVKIYASTWDFDGVNSVFRPLTKDGGPWSMGGGPPPYTPDPNDPTVQISSAPKIMDDIAVITIP